MSFKLVTEIFQIAVFIALLIYCYTLLGFTLYQAVLTVSSILFGMITAIYFALNRED